MLKCQISKPHITVDILNQELCNKFVGFFFVCVRRISNTCLQHDTNRAVVYNQQTSELYDAGRLELSNERDSPNELLQ